MLALPVPILPICSVHSHGPAVIPPAVIPNDDQFPSLSRFCAHWVASEASEVSFCDHPHAGVASPAPALVTGFRIDSDPNVPAHSSVPRKPLSAMRPSHVRLLCRKSRRNTQPQMKGVSLLECALTQKGGGGVPPCFASSPLRFSSESSPGAIMASFGVAIASTRKACGKGEAAWAKLRGISSCCCLRR
jgi:hypothetical protein